MDLHVIRGPRWAQVAEMVRICRSVKPPKSVAHLFQANRFTRTCAVTMHDLTQPDILWCVVRKGKPCMVLQPLVSRSTLPVMPDVCYGFDCDDYRVRSNHVVFRARKAAFLLARIKPVRVLETMRDVVGRLQPVAVSRSEIRCLGCSDFLKHGRGMTPTQYRMIKEAALALRAFPLCSDIRLVKKPDVVWSDKADEYVLVWGCGSVFRSQSSTVQTLLCDMGLTSDEEVTSALPIVSISRRRREPFSIFSYLNAWLPPYQIPNFLYRPDDTQYERTLTALKRLEESLRYETLYLKPNVSVAALGDDSFALKFQKVLPPKREETIVSRAYDAVLKSNLGDETLARLQVAVEKRRYEKIERLTKPPQKRHGGLRDLRSQNRDQRKRLKAMR